MNKHIKTIIFILLIVSIIPAFGQDDTKVKKIKEYYIALSSFSPVSASLKHKRQMGKTTFFKVGLIDLSFHEETVTPGQLFSFPTIRTTYGGGLECGIEFRKLKTEKFTFYHGPNLSFEYDRKIVYQDNPFFQLDERDEVTHTFTGGIPYTFGLLFQLNNHLLLSTEINPGLFVTYSERIPRLNIDHNASSSTIDFKLSNNAVLFSLVYRL